VLQPARAHVGDDTLSGSKYPWLYAEENRPAQHRGGSPNSRPPR
jgi:hypothetical protein